jgi:hypothetical protein
VDRFDPVCERITHYKRVGRLARYLFRCQLRSQGSGFLTSLQSAKDKKKWLAFVRLLASPHKGDCLGVVWTVELRGMFLLSGATRPDDAHDGLMRQHWPSSKLRIRVEGL